MEPAGGAFESGAQHAPARLEHTHMMLQPSQDLIQLTVRKSSA
jgi:hypothetical protein